MSVLIRFLHPTIQYEQNVIHVSACYKHLSTQIIQAIHTRCRPYSLRATLQAVQALRACVPIHSLTVSKELKSVSYLMATYFEDRT